MRVWRFEFGVFRPWAPILFESWLPMNCGCYMLVPLGIYLTFLGDECYSAVLKRRARYYRCRSRHPKLLKFYAKRKRTR